MSRKIEVKNRLDLSEEEKTIHANSFGKILILEYTKESTSPFVDKFLTLYVKNSRVLQANLDCIDNPSKIGAIYIGKIKNVVKNLNACFIEIAKDEICFLALKDAKDPIMVNRPYDGRILIGDEIVVQVIQDSIKTKQPAVSTKISLPGSLVVVSLDGNRVNLSTKLSREQKESMKNTLLTHNLINEDGILVHEDELPDYSLIVRTEAGSCEDSNEWINQYKEKCLELKELIKKSKYMTCYSCLRSSNPSYISSILQFSSKDYQEIITNSDAIYNNLIDYYKENNNSMLQNIRFYNDATYPLDKLYQVDKYMKEALSPKVWLKSGAYLVIEQTEALVVIDVNSGKCDLKKNAAEIAMKINIEAAQEIAIQTRLRNLSGIIIVDFISMTSKQDENMLLKTLEKLFKEDPIHTDVIDITSLGLVEITRKKINKSLKEQVAL